MRWPRSRVAFSMPTTSTPVAIGSSVPAWPTRRVCARRRTRATTSCDVRPAGLSTMSRPDGHGSGRSAAPRGRWPVTGSLVLVVLVVAYVPVVLVVLGPVVGGLLVRVRVAGPLGALVGAG